MLPARAIKKYILLVVCAFSVSGNLGAQKLLDSIVTYYYPTGRDSVNAVKIANEYNGTGQLASYSIYLWTGQWEGWSFPCEECSSNPGRYEYGYDERGDQVFEMAFTWWGPQLEWVESSRFRTENGYDDRGDKVSTTYLGWNFTKNEWYPYFAYEYGYDEAGHILFKSTYDRDPTSTHWHGLENMLYSFDSQGRKTLEIRQIGSDTSRDWVNQRKTEWYYDSPGITTEYAFYRWTLAGTIYEWQEDQRYRIIKEFDPAGNPVLITESLKVSKTRWTPTMKEERAYNLSGQPVLSVISRGNGSLTEDFRSEWVYDPDGRLIQETLTGAQVRRPGPLPIKKKSRTIRTFDNEGNTIRVIWYFWDALTKSYLFDSKDYYFYHPTATSHQETALEPVTVYPNPTGGILNLSGLSKPVTVEIYSMQGMLLRSVSHVKISIVISDLPPGFYLVRVVDDGKTLLKTPVIKE